MEAIKILIQEIENYNEWLGEETNKLLRESGLDPQNAPEEERKNFEDSVIENEYKELSLFEMSIKAAAVNAYDELKVTRISKGIGLPHVAAWLDFNGDKVSIGTGDIKIFEAAVTWGVSGTEFSSASSFFFSSPREDIICDSRLAGDFHDIIMFVQDFYPTFELDSIYLMD